MPWMRDPYLLVDRLHDVGWLRTAIRRGSVDLLRRHGAGYVAHVTDVVGALTGGNSLKLRLLEDLRLPLEQRTPDPCSRPEVPELLVDHSRILVSDIGWLDAAERSGRDTSRIAAREEDTGVRPGRAAARGPARSTSVRGRCEAGDQGRLGPSRPPGWGL